MYIIKYICLNLEIWPQLHILILTGKLSWHAFKKIKKNEQIKF